MVMNLVYGDLGISLKQVFITISPIWFIVKHNHIKYTIILAEKQNLKEELKKSNENKLSIKSHVPCTECGTCFVCKTSFSQCNDQMCIMWNSSKAL